MANCKKRILLQKFNSQFNPINFKHIATVEKTFFSQIFINIHISSLSLSRMKKIFWRNNNSADYDICLHIERPIYSNIIPTNKFECRDVEGEILAASSEAFIYFQIKVTECWKPAY